jgi:hypothetical protein
LDDWKQGHYSCGEEFLVVREGETFSETFPFPLVSAILLLCSHNTVITVKMTTSIMKLRQLEIVTVLGVLRNIDKAWGSEINCSVRYFFVSHCNRGDCVASVGENHTHKNGTHVLMFIYFYLFTYCIYLVIYGLFNEAVVPYPILYGLG